MYIGDVRTNIKKTDHFAFIFLPHGHLNQIENK